MNLWLVVGLGNPGPRYERNRHNAGFMVADVLAQQEGIAAWRNSTRFSAQIAKGTLAENEILLVKPQTFMNLSGRSVGMVARFYSVPVEHILVVHDDVDLDLGRLKIKSGGGDGGHKGVSSMARELGSSAFIRVRFGIGRPQFGDVPDFVLQDFRKDEMHIVKTQISRAAEAAQMVIARGLKEAMNHFNSWAPTVTEN